MRAWGGGGKWLLISGWSTGRISPLSDTCVRHQLCKGKWRDDGLGDLGLDIVYLGFDPAEGLEDRKGAAVGFGDGMVGCELARFEKLDYLSPPLSLQPTRMKQGVHLQMMRRPHSPGSTT